MSWRSDVKKLEIVQIIYKIMLCVHYLTIALSTSKNCKSAWSKISLKAGKKLINSTKRLLRCQKPF